MLVEATSEELALAVPVRTPIGPIATVAEVTARVGDATRTATGRVRCSSIAQAVETADAVGVVADATGLADRPLADDTWSWWQDAWPRYVPGASRGELRALAAVDAAVWALVAPTRVRGSGEGTSAGAEGAAEVQPDVRIYWSGFWLGESPDDARREAGWSAAQGFDAVKMRCDTAELGASVARFGAIADELPDAMGIAVELFGSATFESVTAFVHDVDAARVLWIEDPLPVREPGDTARLAAVLPVPVGGGEHCFGLDALDEYLAAAGIGFPIIDLGRCGGPSALAAWLPSVAGARGGAPVGIHLDATLAAGALARLGVATPVYVEVLDWWERTTPAALRALLATQR